MFLNLTDLSSRPLYQQIIKQIRIQVVSGSLKATNQVPSIRELATKYHISVITVQKAYDELVRQGILIARRGKGFFVADLEVKQRKEIALERLKKKLLPIIKESLEMDISSSQIAKTVKKVMITMGEQSE